MGNCQAIFYRNYCSLSLQQGSRVGDMHGVVTIAVFPCDSNPRGGTYTVLQMPPTFILGTYWCRKCHSLFLQQAPQVWETYIWCRNCCRLSSQQESRVGDIPMVSQLWQLFLWHIPSMCDILVSQTSQPFLATSILRVGGYTCCLCRRLSLQQGPTVEWGRYMLLQL